MYYDNIIIHNWKSARAITATVSFRKGKKIVLTIAMKDIDAVLAYMARQPFCTGIPYRIINHA